MTSFCFHALFLLCLLLATGCAPHLMDTTFTSLRNFGEVSKNFGPPAEQTLLDNGTTRSIWKLDKPKRVPAEWVKRERSRGHDRDGYPVFQAWHEFVPAHMEPFACTLTVLSDHTGTVLDYAYKGKACSQLAEEGGKAFVPDPDQAGLPPLPPKPVPAPWPEEYFTQ